MGDRIFSSDMILSFVVNPMERAYSFGQYEVAARNLAKLRRFLKGFGEGIADMPDMPKAFDKRANDIRTRTGQPNQFLQRCKKYYDDFNGDIYERLGIYIRTEIDALERNNNPYSR